MEELQMLTERLQTLLNRAAVDEAVADLLELRIGDAVEASALLEAVSRVLDEVVPRLVDAGRGQQAKELLRKCIAVLDGHSPTADVVGNVGQLAVDVVDTVSMEASGIGQAALGGARLALWVGGALFVLSLFRR